jgi:hypothetical protein
MPRPPKALTVTALAEGLKLSRRQVKRLLALGMPATSVGSALAWRVEREHARTETAAAKAEALLRWRRARRQLAELELRVAKGDLVDRAEVRQLMGARVLECKKRLLAVPRLAPQLVGKSREEIRRRLRAAFEYALQPLREPLRFPTTPTRGTA